MTGLALKLLACLCMLLDHVGYMTYSEPLRLIGRLALPIFAFQLAQGAAHTRHKGKYLLRLCIFALVSEIPFDLCYFETPLEFHSQNVFFTLALALAAIFAIELLEKREQSRLTHLLPIAAACMLAQLLKSDYGAWGVLMVLVFHYAQKTPRPKMFMAAGLLLVTIAPMVPYLLAGMGVNEWEVQQLWRMAALVPIFLYNGKYAGAYMLERPRLLKTAQYAAYLFYPVHQLVLWILFVFIL